MDTYTTDSLFDESITLKQKRKGYRFTIDPILLSHFVRPGDRDNVVDLGTGSGIIPLILTHRYQGLSVTGVEIQEPLAGLAKENVRSNNLSNRITILHGDMNNLEFRAKLANTNLVVSNPPYIRHKAGRINPMHEKAIARHEITITLTQLIRTAWEILATDGRFALVFPHNRLTELLTTLENEGFKPTRIRFVHPIKGSPPKRLLVESEKCGTQGLATDPPLFIFECHGIYSDEVSAMLYKKTSHLS